MPQSHDAGNWRSAGSGLTMSLGLVGQASQAAFQAVFRAQRSRGLGKDQIFHGIATPRGGRRRTRCGLQVCHAAVVIPISRAMFPQLRAWQSCSCTPTLKRRYFISETSPSQFWRLTCLPAKQLGCSAERTLLLLAAHRAARHDFVLTGQLDHLVSEPSAAA